jgi:hypothetical protein
MTPRLRTIITNLCDFGAVVWAAYVLLTYAWPACSFAVVPVWYVIANRRKRWEIGDRDRVIACHADRIKQLDEALSKCTRGRSKFRLIKRGGGQ